MDWKHSICIVGCCSVCSDYAANQKNSSSQCVGETVELNSFITNKGAASKWLKTYKRQRLYLHNFWENENRAQHQTALKMVFKGIRSGLSYKPTGKKDGTIWSLPKRLFWIYDANEIDWVRGWTTAIQQCSSDLHIAAKQKMLEIEALFHMRRDDFCLNETLYSK